MKSNETTQGIGRAVALALVLFLLSGCAARQAEDSLAGSTAQKLVSYGIDDLVRSLPSADFDPWSGKRVVVRTHFVASEDIRRYADERLALELERRFGIDVAFDSDGVDGILNVFYTSLGTNRDTKGFFLPLGFIPGMAPDARINLLTLEQFQGVAEMYYFVGETGIETRGQVLQARTHSDSIGLPIITVPINTIDRD